MKVLNIFHLTSLLALGACASFTETHSCGQTFQIRKQAYRNCSKKISPTESLYGVTKGTSEEWLIEPSYAKIITFSDSEIYLEKKGGGVLRYNFATKKIDEQAFKSIQKVKSSAKYGTDEAYVAHYYDDDIEILEKKYAQPIGRIRNVDRPLPNGLGVIPPYFISRYGGFLIRHNENGRRSYQVYSRYAKPLTEKYPAEEVKMLLSETSGDYLAFRQVDKAQDLYWPLIFNEQGTVKMPEFLKGVVINPSYYLDDGRAMIYPFYSGLGFVFKGAEGQADYVVFGDTDFYKLKSLNGFQNYLGELRKSDPRYYDLSYQTAKSVTNHGKVIDQRFVILRNSDNFYGHTYNLRFLWTDLKHTTLAQVTEELNQMTANIDKQVATALKNRAIDVAQNQETRARVKVMDDAAAQAQRDEVAAARARNEAAKKAESDKV